MARPIAGRFYPGSLGLPLTGDPGITRLGASRRYCTGVALPDVLVALLLADIEQKRSLLQQQGVEIQIISCKI